MMFNREIALPYRGSHIRGHFHAHNPVVFFSSVHVTTTHDEQIGRHDNKSIGIASCLFASRSVYLFLSLCTIMIGTYVGVSNEMKRKLEETRGTHDDECKFIPLNTDKSSWVRTFHYMGEKVDDRLFARLWALHPETHAKVMIYGKLTPVPRWQQTYGTKGYNFSGVEHTALEIPEILAPFLAYANKVCAPYLKSYNGHQFNMIFLNWYEDGRHYIGYHADDEKQLFHNEAGETLVFSLTFGATRQFYLRENVETKPLPKPIKLTLSHGSAILMGGTCQETHKHCVPRINGKKATTIGQRINMTFRIFK